MANFHEQWDGPAYIKDAGWHDGSIQGVEMRRRASGDKDALDVTFRDQHGATCRGTWWLTDAAAWTIVDLFKKAGLQKDDLPIESQDLNRRHWDKLVGQNISFCTALTVSRKDGKTYANVEEVDFAGGGNDTAPPDRETPIPPTDEDSNLPVEEDSPF